MAGDVTGSTRAVAPGAVPVRARSDASGKPPSDARVFSQSRFQTLPVPYLYFTWPGAKKAIRRNAPCEPPVPAGRLDVATEEDYPSPSSDSPLPVFIRLPRRLSTSCGPLVLWARGGVAVRAARTSTPQRHRREGRACTKGSTRLRGRTPYSVAPGTKQLSIFSVRNFRSKFRPMKTIFDTLRSPFCH